MIELKSCPFCGGTDLDRYRFTRAGYIDKPAWYEEKSASGDWFRIECNHCGCSLDKHEDELFDCIFNSCDYEITEDDLWNVMFGKWNDRAPSEEEEGFR